MEEVKKVKAEVEACKEKIECLNEMNTKILQDIVIFPKRISISGDESISVAEKLKPKIEFCFKSNLDGFHADGLKIYEAIVTCIKNKF